MKPKLPPRPDLKRAVSKAAGRIRANVPLPGQTEAPPGPMEIAAAQREVNAILGTVKKSPMARSREVLLLEEYLVELISRGGSYEDFVADVRQRAEEEAKKCRQVLDFVVGVVRGMRPPDFRHRLRTEVLGPAKRGQITSEEAWRRTHDISGRNLMREADVNVPRWTFTIGVSGDGGLILGGELSRSLGGLRHRSACVVDSIAIALGLYAGLSASAKVSASRCSPHDLAGVAVTYTLGATCYVGVAASLALAPVGIMRPPYHRPVIEWEFDGVSAAISGGGDIQASVGLEYTVVTTLRGEVM